MRHAVGSATADSRLNADNSLKIRGLRSGTTLERGFVSPLLRSFGSTAMAYKIVASQCTVCGACEFECPNAAIRLKNDMYIIDPKKCTECVGHFDTPHCAG